MKELKLWQKGMILVAVPLVFWLFGPAFLVIATIGLLIVLYRVYRNQFII